MADAGKHLVFVYGTLRAGASNAHRMAGAEYVGRGEVRGRLYHVTWYPALVLDPEAEAVTGDVWQIDAAMLPALDEFEGLPPGETEGEEYRRVRVRVRLLGETGPGDGVEAWMWEWRGEVDGYPRVTSGNWLDVEG